MQPPDPTLGATPIRVVIADDHPAFRAALAGAIEAIAPDIAVVALCEDGRAAVEAVRRLHPDAVMMDAEMPNVNGPEAIRAICAAEPDACVLGMSVRDEMAHVMIEAGAKGFLPKSCGAGKVCEAVRRAVAGLPIDEGGADVA